MRLAFLILASSLAFGATVNICSTAVCNGTTNDTTAVQNAINGSSNGDTILWTGVTKVTSVITFPSNRTYTGSNGGGLLAAAGITAQMITLASNPSNVTVSNMVLDGGLVGGGIIIPGSVQGANIHIDGNTFQHLRSSIDNGAVGVFAGNGINGSSINNNTFTDVYDSRVLGGEVCGAIWIWNSNNSTITGNTFTRTCQAMHVSQTVPYATPSTDLTISNNIITRSARYNIEVQGTIINNLIISGNYIADFEPGINGQNAISAAVAGTGKQIINNVLYGPNQGNPSNQSSAIESEGTGFIISGNLAGHFGVAQSVLYTDTTWQTTNNMWCDMNGLPPPQNIIFFDTNGLPPAVNTGNTYTSNCWPAPITTTTATSITSTTASSGGTVTSNGGASVTSQGVAYGTSANPTIAGPHTSNGTSTPFTSPISGLSPSTTYHYRAYATNSVGTGYGLDKVFTTSAAAGPCTTDSPGWCVTGLPSVQDNLLGPLIPVGADPWVYGDLMEKAVIDTMAPNALAETPVLGTAFSGTVSWTAATQTINTTVDLSGALAGQHYIVIAWNPPGESAGTGRSVCDIQSFTSSTITCRTNIFAPSGSGVTLYHVSDVAGPSGFTPMLGWTGPGQPSSTWGYYDAAMGIYRWHYRLGASDSTYIGYARSYADIQWQWTIDHGYAYPVPRVAPMISAFFRALDGHSERFPGLYAEVGQLLASWGYVDQTGFANTDMREAGYALWDAALGAKTDPDATRHAQYCTWVAYYTGLTNNVQYPDGSFGENDFALNSTFVAAPKSFTGTAFFQGAPWRQAINVKALQAVYESLSDTSAQGCNNGGANTALAAATLTVITNAVTWQRNYGRDTVDRGSYYEVNSQSQDQNSVSGTGTASYTAPSTSVIGVGTNWQTAGMCDGTHIIGFVNPRYTYKIASCSSNTTATLSTPTGFYGESGTSASTLRYAPPAYTPCNSSASFCFGPTGDRNLTRTQCGGFGWLYSHILSATYQGWLNECLSATLGGPTAGPTNADTVGAPTLPCSGPACDGWITDTGDAMRSCASSGGIPPCQNFTDIGNLGKNFGEAFGAPGIDNGLAWRLLSPVTPPVITSTSPITQGTVAVPYAYQFNATGTGPITWSGTNLPAWASLSPGGLLTGTPTVAAVSTLAITATNNGGPTGPQNFSLTVVNGPTLPVITSTSPLPTGRFGVAYSYQFTATGTAPITWSATGLPAWASLSSTGLLTGTPTAIATTTIAVTATNVAGVAGPTNFSLPITAVPPTITSTSPLPGGTTGIAYSYQFTATGGTPITWSGTGLPAWASLSSGGLLTGTPNIVAVSSLMITATNSAGAAGPTPFSLTVVAGGVAPTITTTSPITTAHYGVAYSFQFAATGTAPITWSGTALPSWASLSSTGFLTGTPDAVATTTIHVTATNGIGSAGPTDFSLSVVGVVPAITSASPIPNGLVGSSYSYQFTGTGTPNVLTWTQQSGLPAWASFSSTGLLTGVPPVSSANTLFVTATNTAGSSASTPFSWTITGGTPPTVTCSPQSGLTPPNVTDVRLQTNMALNLTACTNSLTQTGTCTVVDVQRVVNSALGGACLIGP